MAGNTVSSGKESVSWAGAGREGGHPSRGVGFEAFEPLTRYCTSFWKVRSIPLQSISPQSLPFTTIHVRCAMPFYVPFLLGSSLAP